MAQRMLSIALALVLAPAAFAAPQTMPAQSSASAGMQQPAPTPQARAQAIQQQLAAIRAATLEANEVLADRQQDLNDLLLETMRANGHTPEADIAKLREIRDDLQDEALSQVEQQTLIQEFQQVQATLAGARQQAMATEEMRTRGQAFQQDLLTAMQEQDSRTQALLQRMAMLQDEMQGR